MGNYIARFFSWRRIDSEGEKEESLESACSTDNLLFPDDFQVLANASPISLEDDSDPAIERLPFDLLLRIFSFLDVVSLCRCAQVSKKWHELALDGSNWQCVDLFDFQIDIEEQMVDRLSQRCGGFLHELSLKGCEGVGDSAIK
jgi:hypothetical protein